MLVEINEVLKLIREGENERIEFKEKVSQIGEEICALANADGGYILIGVDDEGNIVGINTRKARSEVSAALTNVSPTPRISMTEVSIGGRSILVIRVHRAENLCSIGGRAYIRIGTSKRPLSVEEIIRKSAEMTLVPIDNAPTDLKVEDLWEDALEFYKERLKHRNIYVGDVREFLRKTGMILPDGRITFAAALLFTKEPQIRFPQAYLRIVQGSRWTRLKGPLWRLVEDAMEYISNAIPVQWEVAGVRREEIATIPLDAVREALVNALVHRNYADYSETFLEVSPGSIAIKNPGAFPPGVSIERPRPNPRNPTIYERMFEMGYVEKRGRGIELMKNLCKSVNCTLKIESSEGWTEVSFRAGEIDPRTMKVLRLLDVPRSSSEIAKAMGVSKVTALKLLKRLVSLGLVEEVGRGRSRKYKKR